MATSTLTRPSTIVGFLSLRSSRHVLSAGVSVFLVYLFGGLAIQIGVLTQLGLTGSEASSWFFITWLTTGLFSLVLALVTRLPLSINLSIPALIFLAGSAEGFTLPQILGANLAVGLAAVALSALRLTDAFARLVPSPIAMAVFAGSILAFLSETAEFAVTDLTAAGPVVAGYAIGLLITRSQLAAVGTAAATGFFGVVVTVGLPGAGDSMSLPPVALPAIEFSLAAIVALGIPILILTAGVGNIQSLAIVRSEGYTPNGNLFGVAAGAASVINALGGGHPAAIGGSVTAIASGPAAGPRESRFWAIVLSSLPVVAIALAAIPIITIVQQIPVAYTLSVGALALLAPFRHVIGKTWHGPMRASAVTSFVLAALPFQIVGMPMAFWAILAGVAVVSGIEAGRMLQRRRPGKQSAVYQEKPRTGLAHPEAKVRRSYSQ